MAKSVLAKTRRNRSMSDEKRREVGAGVDLNEDIHTADHLGDDQEVTAETDITRVEGAQGLLTQGKGKDILGGDILDHGPDHGPGEEIARKKPKIDIAE